VAQKNNCKSAATKGLIAQAF